LLGDRESGGDPEGGEVALAEDAAFEERSIGGKQDSLDTQGFAKGLVIVEIGLPDGDIAGCAQPTCKAPETGVAEEGEGVRLALGHCG